MLKRIDRKNPISISLLVLFTLQIVFITLTYFTKFNMIGLQYEVNGLTVLFEKGTFEKEIIPVEITKENSLQIMKLAFSIGRANNLWEVNIFLFPFVLTLFISLILSKVRFKKWYTSLYLFILIGIISWNTATIKDINRDIQQHSFLLEMGNE